MDKGSPQNFGVTGLVKRHKIQINFLFLFFNIQLYFLYIFLSFIDQMFTVTIITKLTYIS